MTETILFQAIDIKYQEMREELSQSETLELLGSVFGMATIAEWLEERQQSLIEELIQGDK